MRKILLWAAMAAAITSTVLSPAYAADKGAVALTGTVTSPQEGLMEGVLVTAKADGGTIAITVVSNDKGRYAFPASKLAPGHYNLKIRAIGYDLVGPKTADVAAGAAAAADITLAPTKNLAAQLSNAEWMESMPGTDAQKHTLWDCGVCHTLQRLVNSKHDAEEFVPLINRMSMYSQGATPAHPQLKKGVRGSLSDDNTPIGDKSTVRAAAEWMATINLNGRDTWSYALKTFPRPKGKATHVVITEYDLARKDAQPHDVIVDNKGIAWYSDFGSQFIGKLDPATGKVTDYPVPTLKADEPKGLLEEEFDKDGNIWLALMHQGGIGKFDIKTEKVEAYPLPPEVQTDDTSETMVEPRGMAVDGKVWTNNQDDHSFLRFDPKTGVWDKLGTYKIPGENRKLASYGIPADSTNSIYVLEYGAADIARIDAKTNQIKVFYTPTPFSKPRRGDVDEQGHLWFAEFGANRIGMFDPKTEVIKEWLLPTTWNGPYMATPDRTGHVWSGAMLSDRIHRLDPKTGEIVEYLLPRETNVRRVFVQNATPTPTFWVGNDHGASIIKLEPQD
ncbi:MAG TPA: carboxypeptidase regulatory-like domain-containing protein [Caulobacteraceae bacterium]|nr:carboxypeptidase regulatory-like domain-containing protein [Caulobacteraceae bacterium]